MAEAFYQFYAPRQYHAISAGLGDRVEEGSYLPSVIHTVMSETPCDISKKRRKQFKSALLEGIDLIVCLAAPGELTTASERARLLEAQGKEFIHWAIEDGRGKNEAFIRGMRDEIEVYVKMLLVKPAATKRHNV